MNTSTFVPQPLHNAISKPDLEEHRTAEEGRWEPKDLRTTEKISRAAGNHSARPRPISPLFSTFPMRWNEPQRHPHLHLQSKHPKKFPGPICGCDEFDRGGLACRGAVLVIYAPPESAVWFGEWYEMECREGRMQYQQAPWPCAIRSILDE